MRVGSVVLLRNGIGIQSYDWKTFRPMGHLQRIFDALDEYGCDEIAVIRPVRKGDSLTKFSEDIKSLRESRTMTPMSFGGGIRSIEHVKLLAGTPIERLIFSSEFILGDHKVIEYSKKLYGRQAIQCLLPIKWDNGAPKVFLSKQEVFFDINDLDFNLIDMHANEVIIVDVSAEGNSDQFNYGLLDCLPIEAERTVISGGIGLITARQAAERKLASVLIDNRTLHEEYLISDFKKNAALS